MFTNTKQWLLGVTLVLSTVVLWPACSGSQDQSTSQETTTKQEKKKVVYYCPMECEGNKTYDKPGKCPECGMKLKKKEVNK